MPSLADRLLLSFFAAALFISAALLFLIQPMVARMILPFLGGSPAVWNTCLFFFQSLLLAGYLYAHFGSSWLGVKRHMAFHLVVVVAALYFLPVAIAPERLESSDAAPAVLVLAVLAISVGFPFFVLSANAPLLQKWFSLTGHPAARDPYFLYAASNAGSLLGLLAYPLLLEPHLALLEQSRFWMYVYACFLALALACGWMVRRAPETSDPGTEPGSDARSRPLAMMPTRERRLGWILLSFVPSSLLLGVTTYVTSDLASVPLLWVLPLSLYLISFIIAFRSPAWAANPFLAKRLGFLLLATAITFFAKATEPALILLPLHLLTFFLTGLVCHGELAKHRPAPGHLTEYYLWISFGGLLGGFFNAFLAPLIFSSVMEYPLAMIAAAWVLPRGSEPPRTRARTYADVLLPLGLCAFLAILVLWTRNHEILSAQQAHFLIFGTAALSGLSFFRSRLRFALGMAAILLGTFQYTGSFGALLFTERSFFGVYRGLRDPEQRFHFLFHGTTLHGAQSLVPATRLKPLSYYYPTSPAGQLFAALGTRGFEQPVAIVGLGVGAMACYGREGQLVDFYEIDPLVERIARDEKFFTFLKDCPPRTSVRIGDARITLNQGAQHSYGLLVLDAFSGDSIPVHLMTREAVELYLAKLQPDGLLLFHLSNRYMDLTRVVGRLASRLGLAALVQHDATLSAEESAEGKQPSSWVVLSRQNQALGPLAGDPRWQELSDDGGEIWTDDYSNILHVLRW